MIPRNLLLAFLSLQAQDQGRSGAPQSSQLNLNVFNSVSTTPANYQVKGFQDLEPVHIEKHDHQSLISNKERKFYRFPHDNKNIKGAYPNFAGINVIFEKKWQEVHVTLGYLSPDGFVKGKFSAQCLVNGKPLLKYLFIEEKWTRWIGKVNKGQDEGIDKVDFYLSIKPLASHAGYRFVVKSVTWS